MPMEVNCLNCGHLFLAYPSEVEKGRRYCSLKCRSAHRFGKELADSKTPVEFPCRHCGKTFTMMKSYVTAYRKKFDHDPWYCSMDCSAAGRKADNAARQFFACEQCGKIASRKKYEATGRVKYYIQQRFCSHECANIWKRNSAEQRFLAGEVGRHVKRRGYVWLSLPANLNGGVKGAILEHRYVMEKHLGRKLLPEETVHHINGDRQNNAIENLELFSSRHGPGQRVIDKVAFAVEMLETYPQFITPALQERLLNIEVWQERKFHSG